MKTQLKTQGISAEQLLRLGRHHDAERKARTVLKADPLHIGALETLAKVQWHLNKFDELLPTLDQLISLNPYEPGYHALRGAAHQALGHCGQAVVSFSRCTEGETPEAANARDQIADLQAWQRFLIAEMLQDDAVFRADYAHDPRAACQKRGFEFVDETHTHDAWLPTAHAAVVWARPS